MVLYARSDIIRQSAMPGGCGNPHVRPTRPGLEGDEPVPIWGIDCPPCEVILNDDVRWSRSRFRIPLTPDEEVELQEQKEAAQAAMHNQQILAARAAAEAALVARGAAPEIDPTDIAITGSEPVPVSPVNAEKASPASNAGDYGALRIADLKALARDRGLTVSGTKDDLIGRHMEYDQNRG